MDDPLLVGVAERVGDLFGDVHDVVDRQRVLLVVLQELAEVAAVQQLHHEVEHALVLAEVVDNGDAPVLEGGGDPGLAAEAFADDAGVVLVVLGAHGLEALDGDLAAQCLVAGAPDLAHAAAPDQVEQPVPALDQPGFRHPSCRPRRSACCRRALPGPSSMAACFFSVYGVGRTAGPSRAIAFMM